MNDFTSLHSGNLVAVRTESPEDAPWIARVTGVQADTVEVVWMEGTYSKSWKVAKHVMNGKLVEWTDCIEKCTIILYDFKLTKAGRLRKTTVDALKSLYREYCS